MQWVLFQEPNNTMVVSFADAADHGATTLTAASGQCCRPLHGGKQRKRSLHQKVLCKILGTETR